ncbi:MAG: DUF2541 family protein [Alphaproteobacteria bacterium]|nr:MAG: DUF2541 family protein [Alphaproteobacteria bacterium]
MTFKFKLCLAALTAALSISFVSSAWADDWVKLGTRDVSDRTETDTIQLSGHRDFKKLKFCVKRNPVSFKDVDVYYQNGGHQDISLRSRINAGDCTRVIDLDGGDRDITRIVMRYEETSRKRAHATVVVWGKK